jgi:hypothetical protein
MHLGEGVFERRWEGIHCDSGEYCWDTDIVMVFRGCLHARKKLLKIWRGVCCRIIRHGQAACW